MNAIKLLEAIGDIDDEMIERANQTIAVKNHKMKRYYRLAPAIGLIIVCMLLYKLPFINAAVDAIITGVQKITSNYNDQSLDQYKVKVGQSKSLDGLVMSVNEVVLESEKLIVQCNFKHENSNEKDDMVLPYEWPFCFRLENSGETVLDTQNNEDIITAAYEAKDGSSELIFSINLKEIQDVKGLLDHMLQMTFYYNNGKLKDQGYTFDFMPKKIYQEKFVGINKNYNVNSYGSFSINKITKEALYLDFALDSKLQSNGNDEFDYKLVDEEGNEYLQMRKYDGNIWFVRPDNLNKKLYMEVMLIKFDKNGVGKEQMIDKYPIPSIN